MQITVAGEPLELLPERAVYWPREATLIVADLHWGKAASFRAAGIPVPGGTTTADLARLDAALLGTGARRLLVLGDLIHARTAQQARTTLARIHEWRLRWGGLECVLVRGNHDHAAGDPPLALGFQVLDQAFESPFVFRHHPSVSDLGYTLAGHLHPGIRLSGRGDRLRLPCFHFGRRSGVLPAFGSFTGWAAPALAPGDRLFVIGDGEVHALPAEPGRSIRI